jgi:hypothetical protein
MRLSPAFVLNSDPAEQLNAARRISAALLPGSNSEIFHSTCP